MGRLKTRQRLMLEEILNVAGRDSWYLILYKTGGYKIEHEISIGRVKVTDADIKVKIGGTDEWYKYLKVKSTDYEETYEKASKKKKESLLEGVHLWLADVIAVHFDWLY